MFSDRFGPIPEDILQAVIPHQVVYHSIQVDDVAVANVMGQIHHRIHNFELITLLVKF